jgi:hypothetical protein
MASRRRHNEMSHKYQSYTLLPSNNQCVNMPHLPVRNNRKRVLDVRVSPLFKNHRAVTFQRRLYETARVYAILTTASQQLLCSHVTLAQVLTMEAIPSVLTRRSGDFVFKQQHNKPMRICFQDTPAQATSTEVFQRCAHERVGNFATLQQNQSGHQG